MAELSNIPDELRFAIQEMDWHTGMTRRIIHKECSEGKDAALSIIRKADGWWFYCFRCKELKGFIGDHIKSPEEVKIMLENMKKEVPYEYQDVVYLPADCIQMVDNIEDGIPTKAYRWCWDHRIMKEEMEAYSFKWSPSYNRVIIPIYEYGLMKGDVANLLAQKLIGWIGREVDYRKKEERDKAGIPKYLTKKSSEYDHIFFHAPNFKSDTYAIVEDVLSAIRISEAMHCNAIALLTTYFPTRLMLKLRKKKLLLWLDGDMKETMLGYQAKLSQFRIPSRCVFSTRDPKTYNDLAIRQLASGNIGMKENLDATTV